jgi:hypothetical protein
MHAHKRTDRDIPRDRYWAATDWIVPFANRRCDMIAIGVTKPA